MKRTYTKVGQEKGYIKENINQSIKATKWEVFRRENLPFCQGECLKSVITACNIPLSKISRMALHGILTTEKHEYIGFYALDVAYKNGQAQIYITDNGVSACVVASDFEAKE